MPVGFDGTNYSPSATYQQEALAQDQLDASKSTTELVSTAFDDQWMMFGAARAVSDLKTFEPDANYKFNKDYLKDLEMSYGKEAATKLSNSKSQAEFNHYRASLDRDIERNQTLSKYGVAGGAMALVAGLADPVGWVASAATEGVLAATKIKGIYKAATLIGASAAENAAMEAVLYAGDTQKSIDDVYMAAGFGAVMGGTVGYLTRNANPEMSNVLDSMDDAMRRETIQAMEQDAWKAASEMKDVDMKITNHSNDLLAKIGTPTSTKRQKRQNRKLKQLEKQIAKAEPEQAVELTAKRDKLVTKMEVESNSMKAQKEYDDFNNMSYDDKVSFIRSREVPFKTDKKPQARTLEPEDVGEVREPTIEESGGSVGAMKYDPKRAQFNPYAVSEAQADELLDLEIDADKFDHEVATGHRQMPKYVKGVVNSPFAFIMNKGSQTAKGLALKLFENPQGNGYAQKTASIFTEVFGNKMRSAMKNRYNDGFDEYIKEQGVGYRRGYTSRKFQNQFNESVYAAVVNPKGDFSDAVTKAAQGVREQLAESLRLRKEAGEYGFEKVESVDDYIPIIFDNTKMDDLITNKFHGDVNKLVRLIQKGYMNGKIKLGADSAEKLAKVQLSRMAQHNLSLSQSIKGILNSNELESILAQLEKDGVPDAILDDIRMTKETRADVDDMSHRARMSMGINPMVEIDGVRVMDILNTNVPELVENYTKEAAFGASIAKMGFPTKQRLMNTINSIESELQGQVPDGELKKTIKVLTDNVSLLEGRSLDQDPTSLPNVWARRLRDYTAVLRLNKLGIAQLSEAANLLSHLGVGTVMKELRVQDALFGKWSREGNKASGALQDARLRETEAAFGYIQEDNWLHAWNNRHDEFGENPDLEKKLGDVLDRGLAIGGRINSVTSGFKAIQGGLEKLAMRGLVVRLQGHLDGTAKMTDLQLKESGWTPDFMAELSDFYKQNEKFATNPDGSKVRLMNFDAMTPAMREQLGVGLTRQRGRIIQKNFVGEYSAWMNTSLGKIISQFKRFSITSLEKQFMHDIQGDKAIMATRLALSLGIGYASFGVKTAINSIGQEDGYFADNMTGTKGIFGAVSMMPQLAALTLFGDALASLGVMPESMVQQDYGDAGFRQYRDIGDVAPSVGVALDVGSWAKAAGSYITGDDDVSTRQVLDKTRRLVPLSNMAVVGNGFKAMTDLAED